MQMKAFYLISAGSCLSVRVLFLAVTKKPVQSYFENTCHSSTHMHTLCPFTSSLLSLLLSTWDILCLPNSHIDLIQAAQMEVLLLTSPGYGWNTENRCYGISCYPLPGPLLILVVCLLFCQTKHLPLPSRFAFTLSQTIPGPRGSDKIPCGSSGLLSPRRWKILSFATLIILSDVSTTPVFVSVQRILSFFPFRDKEVEEWCKKLHSHINSWHYSHFPYK